MRKDLKNKILEEYNWRAGLEQMLDGNIFHKILPVAGLPTFRLERWERRGIAGRNAARR